MDGAETTLFPRYLLSNLPRDGHSVCIVGEIVDISENNVLTLDCDPENKQQIKVEIPSNIEVAPLKEMKFIEVRGLSREAGDLIMREFTNLKDNFDLKTYNEIITLAYKEFRDIFNYPEVQ